MAAIAAVCAVSCGESVPQYVNPDAKVDHVVKVWVEADPIFNPTDFIDGCMVWRPKGIQCVFAEDKTDADIAVYVDMTPCALNNPEDILALAFSGGTIIFRGPCFYDGGRIDRFQVRGVMGHETGHELGIWTHVPAECEVPVRISPNGQLLCGVALMNPEYDPDVDFITPLDSLAFDMRDLKPSVIGKGGMK